MTPFPQPLPCFLTDGRAWLSGDCLAGNSDWHLQVKIGQDWCPKSDLFCKQCW